MRLRLRTIMFSAALVGGIGLVQQQAAEALVRTKGAESSRVSADRGGRMHRTVNYQDPRGQLAAANLPGWSAAFDDDTLVPYRMWGSSPAIAHVVDDATTAESAARAFLANHIALLAPGSQLSDLVILANELSPTGIRTVTFAQHAQGIAVLGAAVNFAFKNDRLVMVGSTAVPHVAQNIAVPQKALAPTAIARNAAAWLAKAGHDIAPTAADFTSAPAPRAIVPIIRPRIGASPDITYKVTDELEVAATTDAGRWTVWMDAESGAPVARATHLHYAQSSSGTIKFDVPDQSPTGTRSAHAVPFGSFMVNGTAVMSTVEGLLSWDGSSTATVAPQLTGSRVQIHNQAGALVTGSLQLAPNASVTWSQAGDEKSDAQLDSFIYANAAKQFVKTRLNPSLAWLDARMTVNVNENDTCNAFSDGDSVHFFISDSQCENTGRMADVVYHETGHSVHNQSIIPGAGNFDGSLSEGLADTLAVSITGDHGLGRGFFRNSSPLRELAPSTPKHWPEDADGEVHDEGEIIGETLWDVRTALQQKLGTEAGYNQFLGIYYNIVQRSPDIPGAFLEALVADDDNGDLSDGTPNLCELKAAFDRHGLADPKATLGLQAPTRDNFTITLVTKPSPALAACGGTAPSVTSTQVAWRLRGTTTDTSLDLASSNDTFTGTIPTQPDGSVVEYKVTVKLSTGDTLVYPNNPADPYYQFYVGQTTPIWCANFEDGAHDWTHGGTQDQWEVGAPMGLGGDPRTAFEGAGVFGTDLSMDGIYEDNASSFAESPAIDLKGHTKNVHLQYMRWLGVEDGAYDQATIKANGTVVWSNFKNSNPDPQQAEVNHIDKEWRFQDVDLSDAAAASTDGTLKLRFDITSDQGLGFGGWTFDTVCLVSTDPVTDPGTDPTMTKDDGGCCSTSSSPASAISLGALALGLVIRRRRRR